MDEEREGERRKRNDLKEENIPWADREVVGGVVGVFNFFGSDFPSELNNK